MPPQNQSMLSVRLYVSELFTITNTEDYKNIIFMLQKEKNNTLTIVACKYNSITHIEYILSGIPEMSRVLPIEFVNPKQG